MPAVWTRRPGSTGASAATQRVAALACSRDWSEQEPLQPLSLPAHHTELLGQPSVTQFLAGPLVAPGAAVALQPPQPLKGNRVHGQGGRPSQGGQAGRPVLDRAGEFTEPHRRSDRALLQVRVAERLLLRRCFLGIRHGPMGRRPGLPTPGGDGPLSKLAPRALSCSARGCAEVPRAGLPISARTTRATTSTRPSGRTESTGFGTRIPLTDAVRPRVCRTVARNSPP